MENKRGQVLYKFDMSLMERLSDETSDLQFDSVCPSFFILVSCMELIERDSNTLYPGLQDHELVHKYPDVRGIQKNVFFVSHQHRENDGGDDTASKYNTYEVIFRFF